MTKKIPYQYIINVPFVNLRKKMEILIRYSKLHNQDVYIRKPN